MFGKLKQTFGIGTVKVALNVPASVEKAGRELTGTLQLTAQSDQHVQDITIRLMESYSTGRGSEKKTREYELGKLKMPTTFEMQNGEVKEIPFTLPYRIVKSTNDDLKGYGGAIGALGKIGALVDAEKAEYQVHALVSVKGAALSPQDRKNIKLV